MKKRNPSFRFPFRTLAVVLTVLLTTPLLSAQAGWYNPYWSFRREVTVPNPGSTALSEFQVKITLNSSFDFTKAMTDGSDVRIAASDGTTLIPFWIEEWNPAGTAASLWVKVPTIPTGGTTIFIYYGNSSPTAPVSAPVETPPIGPFTRAAGNPITPIGAEGNVSLLAENIVYDPVTQHYWLCQANYSAAAISLCWSDTPTNPASWTWAGNVITTFTSFYSGAPHLLTHNGTWYLFYADRPNLRVATSSNAGGPYTINPTPVLVPTAPTGAWDSFRVDEPYVFQRNDGKWIMIYMADAGSTTEQVGYATADNVGGPYTAYTGNPVIRFGDPGSFDAGTVADPWVYEYHGTYYIGYTVSSTKDSPWQTALATTTDWINFTKHGVILPAAGTVGDQANSFRGALTRIGDEYVLSYTNDGFRMALATQPVFAAPSTSGVINDPDEVFDFYDGFNGTSLDVTKWGYTNGTAPQVSVNGGSATLTSNSAFIRISGTSSFGMNYIGETRAYHPNQGTIPVIAEVGFASTDFTSVRIVDDFLLGTTYWQRQAKISPANDTENPFYNMAQLADRNWHIFRIYRQSPDIAGYQIDDNPVETTNANVPTASIPPFLMAYSEGLTNSFVADWTRVRKWAGADPVTVVGTEETGGGVPAGNQWTGAHPVNGTSFWSDPENWSENVVPDANADVTIPDVTNDPVIDAAASCRSITINSGASLTLGGTTTLSVSGDWTNNGAFSPSGTATVAFNGSTQKIGGSAYHIFYNLAINSSVSATMEANAEIYGDVAVTSGVFDLGTYTVNNSQPAGLFSVSDGASLKIGGIATIPSGYDTYTFGPGSTVEYSGTSQVVAATTYGNLVLSGSGVKSFPAAGLTGMVSLTISGTATALLPNGSTSTTGSLILGGTAALAGSYGSTTSAAVNLNNTYFTAGYSGIINHTVLTAGNWVGGTSADWNNAANWVGGIPGASTNVIVPYYDGYQPVVRPNTPAAVCNNLTVNAGASLTINAGQALTVAGDLSNSGTLTIESSSVNASGSLRVFGSSAGNVTYNRIMNTSNNQYHFFSSPVGSLTFPTTARVWGYNEPAGAWTETTVNVPGRGYTLEKGIEMLNFTGPLVISDLNVPAKSPYGDVIDGSEPNYDGRHFAGESIEYPTGNTGSVRSLTNYGGGGWNLLGNPYTSAMSVGGFISDPANSGKFDPNYVALYLFNGSTYRYVSNPIGNWLNGTALDENFIQAGQGFFVLAMNDYSVFTFKRNMQGHDTDVLLLKSAKTDDRWPGLELKVRYGTKESSTIIVYEESKTAGLDPGYDVGQLSSAPEVEIYTTLVLKDNGVNFARQVLPVSGADKLVVPVGIDSEKGGEVTFSAVTVPLGSYKFWLEDRLAGIFTDLSRSTYKVTLPAKTYGTGRFFLKAGNSITGINLPSLDPDVPDIRIWPAQDKVIIKGAVSERTTAAVYDLQGNKVIETLLTDDELNTIDMPSGSKGVYLVRVTDGVKVTTKKVAIL